MKKWKSESAVVPRVELHEEPKIKMHAASNWETLLPNCIGPGLDLIFIGINPGRHSAEERHHFAGPVNHFWKCLYGSKLTLGLHCSHDDKRLQKLYKIGVTNMVKRPTTLASQINKTEWAAGAKSLYTQLEKYKPKCIAFNGISSYRHFLKFALDKPEALRSGKDGLHIDAGLQPITLFNDQTKIFAMPSSSPLSRLKLDEKVEFYKQIKAHLVEMDRPYFIEGIQDLGSQEVKNSKSYDYWLEFHTVPVFYNFNYEMRFDANPH